MKSRFEWAIATTVALILSVSMWMMGITADAVSKGIAFMHDQNTSFFSDAGMKDHLSASLIAGGLGLWLTGTVIIGGFLISTGLQKRILAFAVAVTAALIGFGVVHITRHAIAINTVGQLYLQTLMKMVDYDSAENDFNAVIDGLARSRQHLPNALALTSSGEPLVVEALPDGTTRVTVPLVEPRRCIHFAREAAMRRDVWGISSVTYRGHRIDISTLVERIVQDTEQSVALQECRGTDAKIDEAGPMIVEFQRVNDKAENRPLRTSYGGTVSIAPASVQGAAGLETTFADMPPADCKKFLSEHSLEFDEIEVEGKMIKSVNLMPSMADIADACSRDRSRVIIREVSRDASGPGALMVEAQ